MSNSTTDKIMKAGLVVIIAHIIFKFAGLIQAAVLGAFFKPDETLNVPQSHRNTIRLNNQLTHHLDKDINLQRSS